MTKQEKLQRIKTGIRIISQNNKLYFIREEIVEGLVGNLYSKLLETFKINQIEDLFTTSTIEKMEEFENLYEIHVKITFFFKNLSPMILNLSQVISRYDIESIHEFEYTENAEE